MLFLLFCSSVFCATAEVLDRPETPPRAHQKENKVSPPSSPQPLPKNLRLAPILMEASISALKTLEKELQEAIEQWRQIVERRKQTVLECRAYQ